jgi:hypothetical protein
MRSIRPRRELAITALCLPALFPLCAFAAEQSESTERRPDVDELVSRLKDSSAWTRYLAAKALGELGPAAKKAVPALARAVADEHESVRAQAAYALGEIGPEAKGAVLALRRALTDSKSSVRLQAACALGEIGPEAKSAALQLANSLRDSDEEVRRWAAWALGKIGPAARPAVPALTRALERGDEKMRTEAEWALRRIARWEWRPPEKKRIELLRKRVITDRGAFRLHTMNWTVQTTVSPEFTAELALFMDIFAGFFGRVAVFKRRALVTRRPKVIVYAKQGEFKAATGDSALGLCDFEIDAEGRWKKFGFSTYARDEDERSFPSFHHDTLLHEGSHVFLQRILGLKDAPIWFDEGVATYFEFWDMRDSFVDNMYFEFWDMRDSFEDNMKARGSRSYRRSMLKEHVASAGGKLPSLGRLMAHRTYEEFCPDDNEPETWANYMLAESFMDFLASTQRGRQAFSVIFQRLVGGRHRGPLLSAAEISVLQPLWHRHIRSVTD